MELKGSKTEKHLMAAFAGESQARNRYNFHVKYGPLIIDIRFKLGVQFLAVCRVNSKISDKIGSKLACFLDDLFSRNHHFYSD